MQSHARNNGLSLGDVVSLIAILSAASFVISGVTHYMIFKRTFRFNYFSIASPSDIAVGGFVTFTFIGAMTLFFALVIAGGLAVIARIGGRRPAKAFTSARWWLKLMTLSAVLSTGYWWGQTIWGNQWPDLGTSLVVSQDSDVRQDCKGGDVGWAGSQAIVVACQDGFRVLRDFEKIQMIPWLDQLEADERQSAIAAASQ
ncbi:hypothetical protein [uncultured Brevundimonas sp.]|uniref:hypothetical protein n=1 Tax=uncultured Brevundimonas sp. TaxID=213418 RepID=UPI0025CFC492|nr:hypothetical protein [uncultured Brevundimonas sp.]